jgi:DNA-directed RNA polymerase sigma subunit (sigma70/sigma32)
MVKRSNAKISRAELIKLRKKFKTDPAVGKELGVTKQRVHQLRVIYGIPSTREGNKERNAKIISLRKQGATFTSIAKKMKLSIEHVRRIVYDSKITSKKKP